MLGCGRLEFEPLAVTNAQVPSIAIDTGVIGADSALVQVRGELDPDFGVSGVLLYDYFDDDGLSKDHRATGVVIDSQGNIMVSVSGMYRFYEADDYLDMAAISMRVLPDGSLDPSYQSGELSEAGVTVDTTLSRNSSNAIVVDDKGVTLGGHRRLSTLDTPTLRYGADGQSDPSFGTKGTSYASEVPGVQVWDIAIDPTDGNYFLVGSVGANALAVAKMLAGDSEPDLTF